MTKVSSSEAYVLRCGYDVGFFDKSDVVAWADRQIADTDVPVDALLDLSMCHEMHPLDVMKCLRVLGTDNPIAGFEVQFGFIGLLFQLQRLSMQLAIRGLWTLVHEEGISDDQQGMIYHLDDGYDLAVAGTCGTLNDIERELIEFVAPFADKLRVQYPHLIPSEIR